MRASLFLSAIFAVSLIGGAASAEKPDNRQKGDVVEKTYLKSATTPRLENRALRTMKTNPSKARDPRPSPGESRWNCGDDCSKQRAIPHTTSESTASRSQQTTKSPMKTNERAEQRWNCPSEGACSGVRSARTSKPEESVGKTAAERAANQRLTVQGKTVGDRAKDNRAKSDTTQLNAAQKRLAEKMQAMLKQKVCEKSGADCDKK